ncbi:MAG: hypothetical protein IPG49_06870 [Proteobacteria bacterium]|nr:hypothetical protein [Pseudomonadota bacterium]
MRVSARKAGAKHRTGLRFRRILLPLLCFLPGLSLAAGVVQLQLARPAVVRNLAPMANAAPGDLRLQLQSQLGTQELLLTPNRTLGVLASRVSGRAQAYRGELAGQPGSWVALTRIGARWTGVIFDGAHYFGVDDARSLAAISVDAAQAAPDSALVFRLADLKTDQKSFEGDMVAPSAEVLAQDVANELAQPQSAEPIMAAVQLATKRLAVALIADAELATQDGAAVETNMLARLNIVDGIFSAQVGVRLQSLSVTVMTAGSQPFTTTDSSALLDELKNYRFGTSTQRSAGLSHLMTGRNLDGRTIGIAYINGLCSNSFSASLSEARSNLQFDALVAAHEIGHVFGAPHDSETGSACEATPATFLMAPQLNQSSTFSQCSLDQVAPVVTRSACLAPVDAADGVVEAPSEVSLPQGLPADVTVAVRSVGNATLTGASLRISLPLVATLLAASSDSGACTITGQVADCPLDSLAPDTRRNVTFRVQRATSGASTASLRLTASNDGLASNNSRSLTLRFAPGADMAAGATLDATSITVGGTVNAVVTLDNRGPADVTDARLVITLPANLTLQSHTVEGITCAPVTEGLTCGPLAMLAASSGRVNLVLRGDVTGSFTLSAVASASAPELQPADNTAQATVQVNSVPVPNPGTGGGGSGGGGGGGSLPLTALALLAALAARIARARRQGFAVAAAKYFAR